MIALLKDERGELIDDGNIAMIWRQLTFDPLPALANEINEMLSVDFSFQGLK